MSTAKVKEVAVEAEVNEPQDGNGAVELTPIQQAYKVAATEFAVKYGERLSDLTTMLRALDQVIFKLVGFAAEAASMPDIARFVIGSTLARQADATVRDLYVALSAWKQEGSEVDVAKVEEFFRLQNESRKVFKEIEQRFATAANDDEQDTGGLDVSEVETSPLIVPDSRI